MKHVLQISIPCKNRHLFILSAVSCYVKKKETFPRATRVSTLANAFFFSSSPSASPTSMPRAREPPHRLPPQGTGSPPPACSFSTAKRLAPRGPSRGLHHEVQEAQGRGRDREERGDRLIGLSMWRRSLGSCFCCGWTRVRPGGCGEGVRSEAVPLLFRDNH